MACTGFRPLQQLSDYNMSKAFQEYSPLFTTAVTNSPFRMFSTEFAPFGQLEIPLTDALNLTTGLRWHTVSRSASVNYEWAFTGADIHTRVEDDWSELLPRVNLSYNVSDDKMVYAGVSRSFIPGGICYTTMTGLGNLKYDSQTAWNYEVGAKTEWFGNRLRINPVLFYSELFGLAGNGLRREHRQLHRQQPRQRRPRPTGPSSTWPG
jgi:iron complex outermembrane receptor protein